MIEYKTNPRTYEFKLLVDLVFNEILRVKFTAMVEIFWYFLLCIVPMQVALLSISLSSTSTIITTLSKLGERENYYYSTNKQLATCSFFSIFICNTTNNNIISNNPVDQDIKNFFFNILLKKRLQLARKKDEYRPKKPFWFFLPPH